METRLKNLSEGLAALEQWVRYRLAELLGREHKIEVEAVRSRLAALELLPGQRLPFEENLALITALAPHLQSDFFDRIFAEVLPQNGDYPSLGGLRGTQFRGFIPTGETLMFLLAGRDLKQRLYLKQLFEETHLFSREGLLYLDPAPPGEPILSGRLSMPSEIVSLLTSGVAEGPRFGMDFPAQYLTTDREWDELVLRPATRDQLAELRNWLTHRHHLLNEWGMGRVFRPGYRALFHGPPGTGKTFTATLLGKVTGRDLFRIDLSMVISKYIGETEKNLEKVFSRAEHRDWILFFDEADALFGKRTGVRDAHDRYANQEVSYLLQRIEQFSGLVILASNLKSNIDTAFMRRFQSVVHFPAPGPEERYQIWQRLLPSQVRLEHGLDMRALCRRYELTGSNIANIMQYALLQTLSRQSDTLQKVDLLEAIEREYQKEGRSL